MTSVRYLKDCANWPVPLTFNHGNTTVTTELRASSNYTQDIPFTSLVIEDWKYQHATHTGRRRHGNKRTATQQQTVGSQMEKNAQTKAHGVELLENRSLLKCEKMLWAEERCKKASATTGKPNLPQVIARGPQGSSRTRMVVGMCENPFPHSPQEHNTA